MARNLTLNGETQTLAHFCRLYGKNYSKTQARLRSNCSLEEALDLVPYKKPKRRPTKVEVVIADDDPEPIAVNYGPHGIPFTRAGHNLFAAALGLLTGEEYLRAEGLPAPPPERVLQEIPREDHKKKRGYRRRKGARATPISAPARVKQLDVIE